MHIPGLWRLRPIKAAIRRWQQDRHIRRAKRNVANFPRVVAPVPHGLEKPLVVTLTSYRPRFDSLGATIRSLLDQEASADRTILWLAAQDRSHLPDDVLALQKHGLEIRLCEDLRSYKKLIPALQENPDRYFVTADDDAYYPRNWLKTLVEHSLQHRRYVCCCSARQIAFDASGSFKSYSEWSRLEGLSKPAANGGLIMPIGRGGVLYPPRCFDPRVIEEKTFMQLAPHGDDLWFYWMARLAGTNHSQVKPGVPVIDWPGSQSVALKSENLYGDRNDQQLKALVKHLGFPGKPALPVQDVVP